MKHLKTFEENYINDMSDMTDPEVGFTPPFESGSEDEVIQRYCEKYPEFSPFFNEFIATYTSKEDFDASILALCEDEYENDPDSYDDDDDDDEDDNYKRNGLTDEEIVEEYWYPELEVNMLETDINEQYPGDEIWVEFYNDLCETDW